MLLILAIFLVPIIARAALFAASDAPELLSADIRSFFVGLL